MKFFISTGELSGDMHASLLVHELKKLLKDAEFVGIGGPNLEREGVKLIMNISEMGIVGLWEAIKAYPRIRKQLKIAEKALKCCDYAIFVDYPGFNLLLSDRAKKLGIKSIYYILPQVWAWGTKRIKKLKRNFALLLSILPFEEEFFERYGVKVHFVGSPVVDRYLMVKEGLEEIDVPENKKVIGILPGSRESEVNRLMPHILRIIEILNSERDDLFFIISNKLKYKLEKLPNLLEWEKAPYPIMAKSHLILTASGTATLETGLFEKPMVVIYKTSPLTYWAGKMVVRVKHISLVNLILEEEVVPEFIQRIDEREIARKILDFLENQELYNSTVEKLKKLKELLKPNAAENAAKLIFEEVSKDGHA